MSNTKNKELPFKRPQTQKEKDELARQYTPLVHKIVMQNLDKSPLSYDDLLGFGFEGLADAMNTYKEGTGQSFLQYAAYRIYYFIKNGTYDQGHIVKFSAYQQQQAKEKGLPTFISKPIVTTTDENGEEHWNIPEPSVDPDKTSVAKALQDLQEFIETRFSSRDADVFFSTFGLAGREEVTRVTIAKRYKVTSASITYINQRIIRAINSDECLREELEDLL